MFYYSYAKGWHVLLINICNRRAAQSPCYHPAALDRIAPGDWMDGISTVALLEINLSLWLGIITAAWYTLLSFLKECVQLLSLDLLLGHMLLDIGDGTFFFGLTVFHNNEAVISDTKWEKEMFFPPSIIHICLVVSGQALNGGKHN